MKPLIGITVNYDIKDEIWDMIGPKNPNYITLEDVLKSSYRDQVLSLLIDVSKFSTIFTNLFSEIFKDTFVVL